MAYSKEDKEKIAELLASLEEAFLNDQLSLMFEYEQKLAQMTNEAFSTKALLALAVEMENSLLTQEYARPSFEQVGIKPWEVNE
ncbi:hypothetical protein DXT76_01100 [Halobacillus trueperi]|uniref:Uncharacterized protein n=1 Tax=Halobacillus trueperi TaxID=156205 RepID=A0A3D8VTI1_9BACI|nr:hypothetical protein [Halobacillus trueperi]RDY72567.1 hypothetical protein DXT76_01100 [Halobacillus trueperi]